MKTELTEISTHFIRPGANLDGDPYIPDPDEEAMSKDHHRVVVWMWPLILAWLLMLASFLWGVSGGL